MHLRTMTCTAVFSLLLTTTSMGAMLDLNGSADLGSRFIEHVQDAFWELGQTRESTRVEFPDGGFIYSDLPDYNPQGGGGTAFPNKQDFQNLGTIEYDEGTGAITGLTFDFEPQVAPGQFTFYQAVASASPYTTSFNSFSGTVTPSGSAFPTINLTSEIVFTVESPIDGTMPYTGTFNVVDNVFVLDVDDSNFSPQYQAFVGDGNIHLEWNVSGSFTPVPEPSTAILLFGGVIALGVCRRRFC